MQLPGCPCQTCKGKGALHNQGDRMFGAPMNRIRTNWQGRCMFASVVFLINFWRVQTVNKCKFVLRHLPEISWKEPLDLCHEEKGMWWFSICSSDTHMSTHSLLLNVYLVLISASASLSVRVRRWLQQNVSMTIKLWFSVGHSVTALVALFIFCHH